MDFIEAIVRRVWDETARLKGIVLEVPEQTVDAYTRAGQFVEVRVGDHDPMPLAVASSPGEARALELLVGEPARTRGAWSVDQRVQLRGPRGAGFPLEMAEGADLLLFAQGSALAALRPVVDAVRRRRDHYRTVRLYIGARSEADLPYAADYPGWRADGIEILPSISRPWVQERFVADPGLLDGAAALVCGSESMMNDVTRTLVAAGVSEARIGRNC